jgi:hypothetical protein
MTIKNAKHRFFLIAAVVIVVIYFGPGIVATLIRASARGSQSGMAKPSPLRPAPFAPAVLPPAAPLSPEAAAEAKYPGIWTGNALMPDQNRCSIKLEIRLSDDSPKKLKGYESESCLPVQPLAGGRLNKGSVADIIRETAPVSAVMTGTPWQGGLTFSIDQTIGSTGPCPLTGFSITDFGQGQVIAQLQEGVCGPGNKMVLKKGRG